MKAKVSHIATLTRWKLPGGQAPPGRKIATRKEKIQIWLFQRPEWVRIGPILKVMHISLLYSPWGPFPNRFVQQTTIFLRRTRPGTVPTGSLAENRTSLDWPSYQDQSEPSFQLSLSFCCLFGSGANFARLEFYSPVRMVWECFGLRWRLDHWTILHNHRTT